MEKTNLGVRPVGGKTSMGESEVVARENKALAEYVKDLKAAGPANCVENSKKHRIALLEYYKKIFPNAYKRTRAFFDEMKLEY